MVRWHCSPDKGFSIRALVVWGRARSLLVTEVPHNIESLRVSGEKTFVFFETWRPEWGSNTRSPTFQAGCFNHSTRAPPSSPVNTRHIWRTFVQCWTNVKNFGPTLYKCQRNILCLLGHALQQQFLWIIVVLFFFQFVYSSTLSGKR